MFSKFFGFFSCEIGIDLGTANTLVNIKDQGIVLDEPSVVSIKKATNKVIAVGDEAKQMLGCTPEDIVAIRPLKDGVIADFEVTEAMLKYFIKKVKPRFFGKVKTVIAIPSGITNAERRILDEATRGAGASDVYLMEEPMAAAIGAGLDVESPEGCMIVDIGGGTTEVAIISLGGIVGSGSIRTAGDQLDKAIIQHMKRHHSLHIGERTAEDIKIQLGSATPLSKEISMEIRGRDVIQGLPKTTSVSSEEIRSALADPISTIVQAVSHVLENCPPEIAADLIESGMTLAGGGSLLRGLDKRLEKETGLPVNIADDPLSCVAEGTGMTLANISLLKRVAKMR